MEALAPIAMLAFVVFTLVNLARYLRAADWNGVVTIVVAWAIGLVACWLFGQSDVGGGLIIPGFTIPLREMGFADLVLAGLITASSAQAFNEFKGAIDGSDSVAKPNLIPGTSNTDDVVVVEHHVG